MNQLIFIGDTHGFIDDFKKQKEIIEKYKPEFVLSEQLQDVYLLNKKDCQNKIYLKRFKEQNKLIRLCHQKNINLIGIDFKNFGFNKRQQKIVLREIKQTRKDFINFNKLTNKRTKHHISLINKYIKLTKKYIVVIIGCWHLKENSSLRKNFKGSTIIFPVDNINQILVEPKEIKRIKYLELIN